MRLSNPGFKGAAKKRKPPCPKQSASPPGTFGVKALERATEELSAHLLSAPVRGLDRDDASWLVDVLRQSDLVKFAKQDMAADAHAHTVQEAIAWVRRTEPRMEDAPADSTGSESGHDDANLNSHG